MPPIKGHKVGWNTKKLVYLYQLCLSLFVEGYTIDRQHQTKVKCRWESLRVKDTRKHPSSYPTNADGLSFNSWVVGGSKSETDGMQRRWLDVVEVCWIRLEQVGQIHWWW